ncbi:MAG: solute carrier family 23 protein [Xanthobacteraceae bacterium]|jgi:xanthine/uracil permease
MMVRSDHEKAGATLAREDGRAGVDILQLRYNLEDRPGPIPSFLFGLQHVLVMFTAMIVSPLVTGQLFNLPAETRNIMIAGGMLGCGAGTVISALGVGWIGSRLPLLLGAYAVYIGPVVVIAKASSLAAATTAMLIGGVALFVISPPLGKLRSLFRPVVVGTLLLITGETLIKIGVNVAAGVNTRFAGNPMALVMLVSPSS